MQNNLVTEALSLFDQEINIFLSDPVTKRGIDRHSEYRPILKREHVIQLCEENPTANIEIVVGKDEGVVALEVGAGVWAENGDESFKDLCEQYGVPETLAYAMPTGEKYYFFRYDENPFAVEDKSGLRWGKATQGYLVYPSRVDENQVQMIGAAGTLQSLSAWLSGSGKEVVIESNPDVDTEVLMQEAEEAAGEVSSGVEVTHQTMLINETPKQFTIACDKPEEILRKEIASFISSGGDKTTILSQALEWNRVNSEPLKLVEIVTVVEELTEASAKEVSPLTPRDKLFKLCEDMSLFHDDQSKPYFFYEGEAFSAPSTHVKNRLMHHYLMEMNDLPPKKELNAVLDILESKARFDGKTISLYNRVSRHDGAIVYDLRDKRYVKVTPEGWEIVPSFPLFRRYLHMQPQCEPQYGGDPWRVFDFLTVPEESRLLVMVYITSLFVPQIAHPVLAVCGDQGSSKSFLSTVINRLVDPTQTERVIQPRTERDLIQTLRQKYVTVLDNLSKIDDRVSDIFCQVCTGGSISYRQLYTDEGENIAQFRHVVILNSIGLAIVNADLMDRSIILKLSRIAPEDRKPEHELWEAFELARPGILGGIFDTISRAMGIYPTVAVDHLPRLADFAKWGYAIANALGESGEQFLEDFNQNVKRQNESIVEKNVLCQAVLTLMAEGKPHLAYVGETHATLKSIAKENARDKTFPKLPHNLRAELDKLRSSLLEHGISYEFLDRQGTGVKILFSKTDSAATPTPATLSPVIVSVLAARDESDEPDEAQSGIPEIEFDEIPEAVNE